MQCELPGGTLPLLPDLRKICIQGKDPPFPAAGTIFNCCITSISFKKPQPKCISSWRKVQESQWKAVGQRPGKAAALEPAQMGWSYRLCRTVLPRVPPLHWDLVQLPHIRHRQQNLRVTQTGLKASGKDNFMSELHLIYEVVEQNMKTESPTYGYYVRFCICLILVFLI